MTDFLVYFIETLVLVLNLAIFGRAIMSSPRISPAGSDPLSAVLFQITEPILKPVRQIMPSTGMLDLSPLVALILLNVITYFIWSVLSEPTARPG